MDPTLLSVLGKILGLGLTAWKARNAGWIPAEDLAVARSLADVGETLAKLSSDKTPIGTQHFVLVVSAFGEALRRHWYGDEHFAPRASRWAWLTGDAASRRRLEQLEERMRMAAPRLLEIGDRPAEHELTSVAALLGDPVGTPYYEALWDAFTTTVREGEDPFIFPNRKLQFEKHFRLAYAEGLASPRGEPVRQHILSLKERRSELVHEIMVRDIAGWGYRHAFWNADGDESLPEMPLAHMYVEPAAGGRDRPDAPVCTLLRELIETHPVIVVRADFGHGKSLTARMLAWSYAQTYLEGASPSPRAWWPLLVRCVDDFLTHGDDLDKILRRALWRQSQGLRLDIPLHDPAFDPAALGGRTIVLIDGLDEVVLGEREVEETFLRMREQAGSDRRFVVFTRPAAIGRGEWLEGTPVIELRGFTTEDDDGKPGGQVGMWLERWRAVSTRRAPVPAELAERDLLHLAKTPILLFMLADVWEEQIAIERLSRGDVYELFFRNIARGKHEKDRDLNRPIADASRELRERLEGRGDIPDGASAPEAMLWLMSRVAWEAKCLEDAAWLERRRVSLSDRHVRQIVSGELGLEGEHVARTVYLGLLLALQANLQDGSVQLLFGHRSFRDFLVARYWDARLRTLIEREDRTWELRPNEPLLAGRLLGADDRSYQFLRDRLARWSEEDRERLGDWARRCFKDERACDGATTLRDDRRPLLREAAAAIATLVGTELAVADDRTLLTLSAWFWVQQVDLMLVAPRLRSPGARLSGACLRRAQLFGAQFDKAHLAAADLSNAVLACSRLEWANLHEARLRGADLRNADLRNADLSEADLREADLGGADLRDADLSGARLRGANLRQADLRGANLTGADYEDSQIDRAKIVAE